MGRIYFYRLSVFTGSLIRSSIALNEEELGPARAGEFFYVDRAPGQYEVAVVSHAISMAGPTTSTLSFTLEPGQNRYIKVVPIVGHGPHCEPEPVDAQQAMSDIASLKQSSPAAAK
jgi:hypothetical protein